jgi:hypothetical protein
MYSCVYIDYTCGSRRIFFVRSVPLEGYYRPKSHSASVLIIYDFKVSFFLSLPYQLTKLIPHLSFPIVWLAGASPCSCDDFLTNTHQRRPSTESCATPRCLSCRNFTCEGSRLSSISRIGSQNLFPDHSLDVLIQLNCSNFSFCESTTMLARFYG